MRIQLLFKILKYIFLNCFLGESGEGLNGLFFRGLIFILFYRTIYMNSLGVEIQHPDILVELYKISHLYQTHDTTDLLSKRMIKNCDEQNVIHFANTAWTYDDVQLKQICERVILV